MRSLDSLLTTECPSSFLLPSSLCGVLSVYMCVISVTRMWFVLVVCNMACVCVCDGYVVFVCAMCVWFVCACYVYVLCV